MKVQIIQNNTKILDEARNEISSRISESYILIPSDGKAIRNTTTGVISQGAVYIPTLKSKNIYEEIDINK